MGLDSALAGSSQADLLLRDPPSLLASSELRDLPLEPTFLVDARITIIHPQLRDLILPLERRKVWYPHGNSIEEISWTERECEDEESDNSAKSGPVRLVNADLQRSANTIGHNHQHNARA